MEQLRLVFRQFINMLSKITTDLRQCIWNTTQDLNTRPVELETNPKHNRYYPSVLDFDVCISAFYRTSWLNG